MSPLGQADAELQDPAQAGRILSKALR